MANELDVLMDADPCELTAKDLDSIVAYHREARAKRASGEKPSKESGPKVSLDGLLKNILGDKKTEVVVKRRI